MTTFPTRAERALVTRRRVVKAAYQRFCRSGYAGATMAAIADDAGVAVQTLYYTFHTKAALLGEALGAAIVGFDLWREPPPNPIDIVELLPWHTWWANVQAAPTSSDALEIFVTHGARILQRVGPLVATLHGAAGDPDAAAVVRIGEERRVASYREVIRAVARKPSGLRRRLSEAAATDIVVVLFSADIYRALSTGRGWSHSRCTKFLGETLTAHLLEPRWVR